MTDQIAICNMALSAAGTRSTIASLSEESAESKACSLWYQSILEMVLRGAHWNFARKQGALALIADATKGQSVPQPWVYEYAMPQDCLQMRYIMPTIQVVPTGQVSPSVAMPDFVGPPVRFVLSSDVDSQQNPINVLLTNMNNATGIWTARINVTANWDSQFVMVMVKALAAHLAIPLTGDKAMAKLKIEEANAILLEARIRNGDEGLTVHDHVPEWMRVRGYASDWAYPDGGYFYWGAQNLTLIS